ncbi:hypothetical protein C8F04DRAFT_1345228 [Mycena alexandri]|uniref:Uncharacterized protein n=1 Tax=Mycena alexandri TaxID=1745969 RepID=A0AAD6X567_9AGAR|nr:hypothetical protein C8F04DRAFT_1345228 [Mycena alexandri]
MPEAADILPVGQLRTYKESETSRPVQYPPSHLSCAATSANTQQTKRNIAAPSKSAYCVLGPPAQGKADAPSFDMVEGVGSSHDDTLSWDFEIHYEEAEATETREYRRSHQVPDGCMASSGHIDYGEIGGLGVAEERLAVAGDGQTAARAGDTAADGRWWWYEVKRHFKVRPPRVHYGTLLESRQHVIASLTRRQPEVLQTFRKDVKS